MDVRRIARREFFAGLGGAAAWPLAAGAQQPQKMSRIGILTFGSASRPALNAIHQQLAELGYIEGQNLIVEERGGVIVDGLPAAAADLVGLKVDVIIALSTLAGRAAQQATTTIPIVVGSMGDPVQDGLVTSLAHPGGNITGTSFLGPELVPKRLELLKELIPSISRVAVLLHPGAFSEQTTTSMLRETQDAAQGFGLQLQQVEAHSPDELEDAFIAIASGRPDALFEFPSGMFFANRARLVELATRHQLPAMYNAREFVQLGGLIAYGANILALNRRTAIFADRILKGGKPFELPVEQPTKFELLINLNTAKSLGISIPPNLLARADEVIE
jgi:putative tryptophan/tyrosine transport system substrate-binding protein